MNKLFTLEKQILSLVILLVYCTFVSLPASAIDPKTAADLERIGALPTDSKETVVKKARAILTANFPDFTPRDLPEAQYKQEYQQRGYVTDEIRKTLKRLKKQFENNQLPLSANGESPQPQPNSKFKINYAEYEFDFELERQLAKGMFAKTPEEHAQYADALEKAKKNRRPNFYDLNEWVKQFEIFATSSEKRDTEQVRKFAKNLRLMSDLLDRKFEDIARSTHHTFIVPGRADRPTEWQLIYERTIEAFQILLKLDLSLVNNSASTKTGSNQAISKQSPLATLIAMSVESPKSDWEIVRLINNLVIGAGYVDLMQKSEMDTKKYMSEDILKLDVSRGRKIIGPILRAAYNNNEDGKLTLLLAFMHQISNFEPRLIYLRELGKTWEVLQLESTKEYIRLLGMTDANIFLDALVKRAIALSSKPNPFITDKFPNGKTTSEFGELIRLAEIIGKASEFESLVGSEILGRLDPDMIISRSKNKNVNSCAKLFGG